jgi:3'-5' exonuclease
MLNELDLTNVLGLDIECVSGHKSYEDMNPVMQSLWDNKSEQIQKAKSAELRLPPKENYTEMAGIYAEYGKVVCVSVGAFYKNKETGELNFRLASYFSHDERQLLLDMADMINRRYNNPQKHRICGHNVKEFDIPYMARRMVINGVALPKLMDLAGKKPWENTALDTMELWKFGDNKAFTALKVLCGVFDIPTPKDDIDGSQVGYTYWQEDDLDRIEKYCRKDVLATAQVLLKLKYMPLLAPHQINGLD